MLDLTKERDIHIEQRLRSNIIAWLSTVRRDGRLHSVPVWFLWDGSTILIFSQPNNQKILNLRHNPNVTLALDDTNGGRDIVVLEGHAELLNDPNLDVRIPAYLAKYGSLITNMVGRTPETMAKMYSQPIRIIPTKFIG